MFRKIKVYKYGRYCEDGTATDRVIVSAFAEDAGFSALALAVEAMGQPIFGAGKRQRS